MKMFPIFIGLLLAACSQSATEANVERPAETEPSNEAVAPEQGNEAAPTQDSEEASRHTSDTGACRTQGGMEIPANRLKAVGTEPFWAATTNGRCVTYTTPENKEGTRIWTAFTGSRDGGKWTGFLGERRFIMETRPEADCSDGMSDRTYPVAVTLTIGSETRRGCATPG